MYKKQHTKTNIFPINDARYGAIIVLFVSNLLKAKPDSITLIDMIGI